MDCHDVLFLFHLNVFSLFRTLSYRFDFVLGCNHVFNIFTFMCHKFYICVHITSLYMPSHMLFVQKNLLVYNMLIIVFKLMNMFNLLHLIWFNI
jgi:hypothetical protein